MWGSASLLVNSSNNPVAGSRAWYLPFGGYRPGSASLLGQGLPGLVWPVFYTRHMCLPVTGLFANGRCLAFVRHHFQAYRPR